jgi:hypothetical protein
MSAQFIERANRSGRASTPGVVVTCTLAADADPNGHDARTRSGIAEKLASLLGYRFAGEFSPQDDYVGARYFVPSDALSAERAASFGIATESDFFGGVVSHAFAATKAITHPLLDTRAFAPAGWVPAFPQAVSASVLEGFTAFTRDDLERAVARRLAHGPVRVKRTLGIGGSGQHVVETLQAMDAVIAQIDDAELSSVGVVVEENLQDVTTYSIGQVRVGDLVVAYHGKQRLTRNNRGNEVYGGSSLFVVRGEFASLLEAPLPDAVRVAVMQARAYDAAAQEHLPNFLASRRNYDVLQGIDARGRPKSGVLEQSWRIGGASGAEVAALQAFANDPSLTSVNAATTEIYGESPPPPSDATVYFRDVDARAGRLTKYSRIEPHAYARRTR